VFMLATHRKSKSHFSSYPLIMTTNSSSSSSSSSSSHALSRGPLSPSSSLATKQATEEEQPAAAAAAVPHHKDIHDFVEVARKGKDEAKAAIERMTKKFKVREGRR